LDDIITTAAGSRKLRINIKGTSMLSCMSQGPILTLTGTAQVTGSGSSSALLKHQFGNLGCSDHERDTEWRVRDGRDEIRVKNG
jgi:hypothetical protein